MALVSSLGIMNAQSISSYVITSAGEAIMSQDGALYLSIGEPMNTELHGGDVMISQGFLQVTIAARVVNTEELLAEEITVYPNPSSQELRFDLKESAEKYGCRIYDVKGTVLQNWNALDQPYVDVSTYPEGTYFLTLHREGKSSRTVQFIKQ